MVPAFYTVLEELPLTANGKVDLKALPKPDMESGRQKQGFKSPETEVEKELADIFTETLEIEAVGIHDPYFSLGGDSLKAVRIINKIKDRFNIDLPIATLLENATISNIASVLGEQGWTAGDETDTFEEGAFTIQ